MKTGYPIVYRLTQADIDAGKANNIVGARLEIIDSNNQPTGTVYESGGLGVSPIEVVSSTGASSGGGGLEIWEASTAVSIGEVRRATIAVGTIGVGDFMSSNSARTTGATFDATEAGNWTELANDPDAVLLTGDQTVAGKKTFSTLPEVSADATTANQLIRKSQLDDTFNTHDHKMSVRAATTANITLSGTQTIDGIAVVASNRVLVKNQTTASQNGIYSVASGAWTRTTDADSTGELNPMCLIGVEEGTTQAKTYWSLTNTGTITISTTALTFEQSAVSKALLDTKANSTSLTDGSVAAYFDRLRWDGATAISSTNLDDLAVSGFYDGQTLTNAPNGATGWFYIVHQRHSNLADPAWNHQTAYALGSGTGSVAGEVYTRAESSGTWSAWTRVDNGNVPALSSTNPLMNGTVAVGTGTTSARTDHVHASDTSKQATLVSGTNVKTVGGQSILGTGDITPSSVLVVTAPIAIKITGATGAGVNYPVKITIGESSGATGANFNLGTAGTFPASKNATSSFIFWDATGVVPFWIEKVTGTTPNRVAHVWIAPTVDLSSGTKTVFLSTEATNAVRSNGVNVFTLFDDFDVATLDATKWDTAVISGQTIASGILSFGGGNTARRLLTLNTVGDGFEIMSLMRASDTAASTSNFGFVETGATASTFSYDNVWNSASRVMVGTTANVLTTNIDNAAGVRQVMRIGRAGGAGSFSSENPVNTFTTASGVPTAVTKSTIYNTYDNSTEIDWVAIKKFVVTEPAFSLAIQ